MSLWKYSFNLVIKELEISNKKKRALDNLYEQKRISDSTYEHLNSDLRKAIAELENHINNLKSKMSERKQELEKQASTLELFLASLEIHHAAGDVNDESYMRQNNAILLGLETTQQEIEEITNSLSGTYSVTSPEQRVEEDTEQRVEEDTEQRVEEDTEQRPLDMNVQTNVLDQGLEESNKDLSLLETRPHQDSSIMVAQDYPEDVSE